MSTYYMKAIVYEPTTDEKEFRDYIEHLEIVHAIKFRIEETEERTYYFGTDQSGEEDLYVIEKKE